MFVHNRISIDYNCNFTQSITSVIQRQQKNGKNFGISRSCGQKARLSPKKRDYESEILMKIPSTAVKAGSQQRVICRVVIPHPFGLLRAGLMRNPGRLQFWIPAFVGMTRHRINRDKTLTVTRYTLSVHSLS
jgi:hypothetical protein